MLYWARLPVKDPTDTTDPASCPDCGLTVTELRAHGRMGCAACYRVFSDTVAQAAAELHGIVVEEKSKPVRPVLPWPTRRAEARPADDAPSPDTRRSSSRRRP